MNPKKLRLKLPILLFLFTITLTSPSDLCSQNSNLSGSILIISNLKPINKAVVVLNQDSVMKDFTRSNDSGYFSFMNLNPGKYQILITYPEYADYVDTFTIQTGEEKKLGDINMIRLSEIIKAIVIKAYNGGIRIKGDTTEYVADSFKTREGATVEDLLQRLPGVQVNKNGEVIAQGKKVEKLLVDGEEFFGDDPTVATKNLDAKYVETVKVYDTKTDNAKATGVDDGTSIKVMDIKLKAANKKGYFGNVSAGHDLTNIYENRAMVNSFTEKRKISAYGLAVNSPNVGLNWDEKNNFGSSDNNREFDPLSGTTTWYSSNDDFQYWATNTSGLPTSKDGGLAYNNKFFNKKLSLNSSYNYKNLILNSTETTNKTTVTKENVINQRSTQNVVNNRTRHSFKLRNEWNIDSFTILRVTANGNATAVKTKTEYLLNSSYDEGQKLNAQTRQVDLDGNSNKVDWNAWFNHKYKSKLGRYYNISYNGNIGSTLSNSFIESDNELFYDSGKQSNIQKLNQKKNEDLNNIRHSLTALYNEPLNKKWALAVSVSENYSKNISKKSTFNNEIINNDFVDSLSSNSNYQVNNTQAGFILKYQRKKINFSVQNFISRVELSQTESIRNYDYSKPYINMLPGINFGYMQSKQSRINASYYLTANQPQIQQIQPLTDNTNPFSIQKGNPDLRQSLNHNIGINFNNGKILKNRWIWARAYANIVQYDLTQSSIIDSFGKSIFQTINVNGNYSYGGSFHYSKSIGKSPVSLDLEYSPYINVQKTFINGLMGTNNSQSHNGSVGLELDFGDIGNIGIDFRHVQNYSKNTINALENNNWTQTISAYFEFMLPGGFSIGADMDANRRQKTAIFKNQVNNTLINSELNKYFYKDRHLIVSLGVYDLLNQNIGYNRSVYNNIISENQFNTFRQFFYGKVLFKFKNKTKAIEGGVKP